MPVAAGPERAVRSPQPVHLRVRDVPQPPGHAYVRVKAQRLPGPPDRAEPDPGFDMVIPLLAPAAAAD